MAALALAVYVQTVRLSGCQAELRGERERVKVMGAQIEAQNAAVAGLEAEGKRRMAESAAEALQARQRNAGLAGQVRTLNEALGASRRDPGKQPPSACPAGDAVREVRRALASR